MFGADEVPHFHDPRGHFWRCNLVSLAADAIHACDIRCCSHEQQHR